MNSLKYIEDNLNKGENVNNYLDFLLKRIAIKYSKYISFDEWNNTTWLNFKEKFKVLYDKTYLLRKGCFNGLFQEMDEYIESWFIEPNKMELIVNLRELINILYKYNKLEYLKLKDKKTNKEKKSFKKLKKEIAVPQYLIWINNYFYPKNNTPDFSYYENNLKTFKEMKDLLSKPIHAHSIFYKKQLNNLSEVENNYFYLLDKILLSEKNKYILSFGGNPGNLNLMDSGIFYDLTKVNDFHDIIKKKCYSLLDVLLDKFNEVLNNKITFFKKLFGKET